MAAELRARRTPVRPVPVRTLAESSLAVPASKRYVWGLRRARDLHQQYLLTVLLSRRLPEYPVDREKRPGVLLDRRFEGEALAGGFDGYQLPTFVPASAHPSHVECFEPLTWNRVTYAVWRDRVLRIPP